MLDLETAFPLASPLLTPSQRPEAGNNQLLAALTDLGMSLPLFVSVSPSEMLSAQVELAVFCPHPLHGV